MASGSIGLDYWSHEQCHVVGRDGNAGIARGVIRKMIDHKVLDGAALLVQRVGRRMIDIAFLETGVDQGLGQVGHQLRPLVQWRLLVQRNAVRRREHGHAAGRIGRHRGLTVCNGLIV